MKNKDFSKTKYTIRIFSFISADYFIKFITLYLVMFSLQMRMFSISVRSIQSSNLPKTLELVMSNAGFDVIFLIMYVLTLALIAFTILKFTTFSKSILTLFAVPGHKHSVLWSLVIIILATVGLLWGFQPLSMLINGNLFYTENGTFIIAVMKSDYLRMFIPVNTVDYLSTLFLLISPIITTVWACLNFTNKPRRTLLFLPPFLFVYILSLLGYKPWYSDSDAFFKIIFTTLHILSCLFIVVFPAMQSLKILRKKDV